MENLRVGLIGLGARGSFLLKDTLLKLEGVQIAAVCMCIQTG